MAVISFLFALSMVMGYQLQNQGLTECGVRGKGMILIRACCLGAAAFPFANLLFAGIEQVKSVDLQKTGKGWKPGVLFAITAAIIFLCLIPV